MQGEPGYLSGLFGAPGPWPLPASAPTARFAHLMQKHNGAPNVSTAHLARSSLTSTPTTSQFPSLKDLFAILRHFAHTALSGRFNSGKVVERVDLALG